MFTCSLRMSMGIIFWYFSCIHPAEALIDHFFDFHLDLDSITPSWGENRDDLDLTEEEINSFRRDLYNDRESSGSDNGGRDFTPDRDR